MEVAGLPGVSRDFHFWQPAPALRLAKQRNPAKGPHTIGNEQAPATLKKKNQWRGGRPRGWGGEKMAGSNLEAWTTQHDGQLSKQINHIIDVGKIKREYARREVPILTLFKPFFNSPVSSLFLKRRSETKRTDVEFPESCHYFSLRSRRS